MTNIIYDDYKTWQGNQANGYYEVETDTIHVLKADDLEMRTIFHEQTHAQRKNHLTFKLASLVANPQINIMLLVMLAAIALTIFISPYPMLLGGFFYAAITFLHIREENIAVNHATKKLSELKEIGIDCCPKCGANYAVTLQRKITLERLRNLSEVHKP